MTITALPDTKLLDQARTGDEGAFTELYVRHHAATLRLARTYRRFDDPGALVNATFERALGALRRGDGPTSSFRAYLYVTLRRLALERAEAMPEASLDDVPAPITAVAAARTSAGNERAVVDDAFDGLADRWQVVLWHTAIEGRRGADLAEALEVTPGAADALAFRAREKLRQSYLQAHGRITPAPDHEPYRSQLGAYARDTLPRVDRDAVRKHLGRCDGCTALLAETENVDRTLARAMLPVFAVVGGGKVAEILAAAAAAGAGGRKGVLGRLRTAAAPLGSTAAIAAVVGGVVGMGSMVAREDAGPLDSAADAADIGPLGLDDADERSSGRGSGDDGSLFGDDDYALSPFDDEFDTYDDEYGGLGDKYDFGDEYDGFGDGLGNGLGDGYPPPRSGRPPTSGIGSNLSPTNPPPTSPPPSSPPPSSPPPTPPPPPASPPPSSPPPTSPPPTSPPPTSPPPTNPPPAPAPLTFTDSSWQPAADDATGMLHFEIGELSPGQGTPAPTSVSMQVTLTGAARFAATGQPPGCAPAGATMTCTFPQPAPGQAGPSFDLAVTLGAPPAEGAPGPVATATIVRDGTVEATRQITLHRYASGLVMGATTWRPGAGVFEVVLDNRHPWPVEGLSLAVELQGGAAPAAGAAQPPGCTAERGPGDTWVIACEVSLPADDSLVLSFPVTVDGQGDQARATVQAGATTLQGMWTSLSTPG